MTTKTPAQFTYYSDVELARAATAPKLSTETRIKMLEEIERREKEAARHDPHQAKGPGQKPG